MPQARLFRLVASRDVLRAQLDRVWARLPKAQPAPLDDWSRAAIALIEVNAGPACHLAFWSATVGASDRIGLLAVCGHAAAEICRHAGSQAALACLDALPGVLVQADADGVQLWWRCLERMAREAPDCLQPFGRHAQALLADRSGGTAANFIAAGLKAYAKDPERRRAFFALEDPWGLDLLSGRPDLPGFNAARPMLSAYLRALWNAGAGLQAAPVREVREARSHIEGTVILLPSHVDAADAGAATRLYVAAVAHAAAHLEHPVRRQPVGSLKPLQVALIGLIEDARVEALAMRRLPGLRSLWTPFHTSLPAGPRTAENLMQRLSRALLDPAHEDPDGFVSKGRSLFGDAAAAGLDDPRLSQHIGRALGHDLGQMRVQFNWRDHVVQPAYRDDGQHLWQGEPQDAAPRDVLVQADRPAGARAAEPAEPDERGPVIATYPEWDAAANAERDGWTTLRESPPMLRRADSLHAALAEQATLRNQIARLVRGSAIARPVRLKRQPDGDELDMDAAQDAMIALRSGTTPDPRVFRATSPRSRDLATVVLLDTSASTAATVSDGRTILDLQRLAVALLAEALDARGDALALRAFASNGREDVRLTRIKDFGERFGDLQLSRLAGLRSRLSTRLGTALRHARQDFVATRSWRRLLLVLGDGEPFDVDVMDSGELVTDARRAVLGLRQAGIDAFGLVLDPQGVGSAEAIFGRSNTIVIRNLGDLPARLAGLYFRLSRR